ncbi:lipopolysaccharide biosynthesis protein [Acetomicrobium sp. UBA5826]|uniref:lipopolysaccharide biosynthesis protein n=1 Tax=Acetomicrobium sp. UBA5826 TaxID=1946039 RepID=UPI00257EC166|nr:lipopolysaccharide biosynthesis protein [Acetomicrobium sp. UBA5826]
MKNTHMNLVKKIQAFLRRPFVRNVTIVASGTAAAQVITMAFSPLITRIYGPEAFGLLGIFKSLVAILTPIAALAYPIAIVLPKEDSEAKGLVKLSFLVSAAIFCAVVVVMLTGGEKLLALLDSEAIAPYVMLIPLSMVFAAYMQIGQQWLIRKKQFAITARVAVLQSFLLNSAKTVIGWVKPVGAVLVVLATLGHGLHAAMLWVGIKKSGTLTENTALKEPSEIPLKKLAKQYYDFPLYRTPQMFINAISQSLPVLMLASFFGPSSAGFYTICRTVLGMPSSLVGQAVGDVFYPRVTEASHRGEDVSRLILKATLALAAVGFLPFAVVVVFGPQLFSFVFGAEWVKAGEYARWIALWMFMGFINRPSVAAIATLSIQGFFLIFEFLSIGSRITALAVGFLFFKNDVIAVALFALVGMLLNLFLISVTLFRAKSLRGAV